MPKCPSCSKDAPDGSVVCPYCATELATQAAGNASVGADDATRADPGPSSFSSISGPGSGGRFLPGTTIADRYRIVGPLGKGGMGEVYRADDLKLGQPVALKFLPKELSDDPDQLERLFNGVRTARRVSHPNVCRVWDIDEADGQHFVAMEYVDGEDLSSLLRRIGRLPHDKAVQIARQLCNGLAAAHDEGILHRDIKPANVMIDGRGRVRLTDFGLAGAAVEVHGRDARTGTPIYMAPEQLARERPGSALAVAAALPGGDPLAAAIAAGETPSPELVAEAGGRGGLEPKLAVPLFGFVVVMLLTIMALNRTATVAGYVPTEDPPLLLAARAQEIIEMLGYEGRPASTASSWLVGSPGARAGTVPVYEYLAARDESAARWDVLATGRPPLVSFWYAASPDQLVPGVAGVNPFSPPRRTTGLTTIVRVGVLGFVAYQITRSWIVSFNPSLDFSPWYGPSQILVMLTILGLAAYAFHTALAGRSVIADPLMEDVAPTGPGLTSLPQWR